MNYKFKTLTESFTWHSIMHFWLNRCKEKNTKKLTRNNLLYFDGSLSHVCRNLATQPWLRPPMIANNVLKLLTCWQYSTHQVPDHITHMLQFWHIWANFDNFCRTVNEKISHENMLASAPSQEEKTPHKWMQTAPIWQTFLRRARVIQLPLKFLSHDVLNKNFRDKLHRLFYRPDRPPFCHPTNSIKSLNGINSYTPVSQTRHCKHRTAHSAAHW